MIAAGFLTQRCQGVHQLTQGSRLRRDGQSAYRTPTAPSAFSIPANLAEISGIDHLAAQLREREDKLNILVNNAGVSWGAPLDEFPESGWDKVFDTNVKGVFFVTQRLLPLLEAGATADDPAT